MDTPDPAPTSQQGDRESPASPLLNYYPCSEIEMEEQMDKECHKHFQADVEKYRRLAQQEQQAQEAQ